MSDRAAETGALLASDVAGPWLGFSLAADAAVRDLHARFGLDLWMVSHVSGDIQEVVASVGPWAELARPGVALPWAGSFCLRMVTLGGPIVEPDVHGSPNYAEIAVGERAHVRAYVGVPLLSSDGRLFGTLCAYSGSPQPASLTQLLGPVTLLGRMLSTIVAGEQVAADRSQEAASAYALADRDRITGLRNRRGWEGALASEEQRARRYGSAASVLVVGLDDKRLDDGGDTDRGDEAPMACAAVLLETCRPGDVLSRMGGEEFGVLAVECDALAARAFAMRLRVGFRSAGMAVSVGCATRRPDERLEHTWRRADAEVSRERRRRHRPPSLGAESTA